MMNTHDPVGGPLPSVRLLALVATALLALPLAAGDARAQPSPTICTGEISGTVGTLIVPASATCTSRHLVVEGHVIVRRGGSLTVGGDGQCLGPEPGTFVTGGGITVARGGSLVVSGTQIDIGGHVSARRASSLGIVKTPCEGARGIVRGHVVSEDVTAVGILGVHVEGSVFVTGSGAEGLEVGVNVIDGMLGVLDNRVVGAHNPSIFAVHHNTVGQDMAVIANDTAGAIVPPLVGGNTILRGDLLCALNAPAPTNWDFDVELPNTVHRGRKLGQCAGL